MDKYSIPSSSLGLCTGGMFLDLLMSGTGCICHATTQGTDQDSTDKHIQPWRNKHFFMFYVYSY